MGEPIPAKSALEFFRIVGNLKHLQRTGWVRNGVERPEPVAAHMYRMALMSWVIADAAVDTNKCIKMSLVHDLAESLVGDITPHCNVSNEEKARLELEAMGKICATLEGSPVASEIYQLFLEYEAGETPEARLVKEIDKMDMILQAAEYEDAQGLNLREFFECTRGRLQHGEVQAWDQTLRQQQHDKGKSS